MIEKTSKIPDGKKGRVEEEIIDYKDAKYLFFPTADLKCPAGETCVFDGDYVKVGQLIGTRHGAFFDQPIHSTVSGKVIGIEKKLHGSSGDVVDCLIIGNDFKYELCTSCKPRTKEEIDKLTKDDYINIIKDSGLSGLGGSGFPTYVKFQTDKTIDVVLANGVECEPIIVSDYQIMKNKPERIVKGLIYSMKALKAPRGVIAIKKKYPKLKEEFDAILANYEEDITVKLVADYYPQGWENETIKSALGIKVPVGTLTNEYGVVVLNVTTLYGIYRAVERKMPITERFFSIAGEGINEPKSFNVRIGTPVKDLIAICGGYADEDIPKELVVGGPMMGNNITNDDFFISKTTTSLIVNNQKIEKELECISCASCVYSCPVDLKPVQIMHAYKARDKEQVATLDVNRCIECGLCSYTCPAKIPLTEIMKQAKRFIKA